MGAVVGATQGHVIARARELMPRSPFLLPGIGAQGGDLAALGPGVRAGARWGTRRRVALGAVRRSRSALAGGRGRGGRAPARRLLGAGDLDDPAAVGYRRAPMARAPANADPDDRIGRRRGFQPSVWTFFAPIALAVCVLVIFVIAREAGWIDRHHAASPTRTTTGSSATGSQAGAAILVRPHKGETLMDIAVRYGISIDRLRALNPKAPTSGELPTTRRVRLR